MEITVSKIASLNPITILQPHGPLDAATYQDLVDAAHLAYDEGCRHLIVDLSDTPYMSSSGIVALHTIALLLHEELPEARGSWDETRNAAQDQQLKRRVKLVNPPPRVDQLLEMAGFKRFIEAYNNLDDAIAAFTKK